MEAYDLYSGTYVALPEAQAAPPKAGSVVTMTEHDQLLQAKGYAGVQEIVESADGGYGRYASSPAMLSYEAALELRERWLATHPAMLEWYSMMRAAMSKQAAYLAAYGGSFITLDEASELKAPEYKWPAKLTYEWLTEPSPVSLRERERAHIKTLNGGNQPWKRKRK